MISRIWHGWTTKKNVGAYEKLLRSEILPGIENSSIEGFIGAHLLCRNVEDGVEFITICWFRHWEAVKEFAGDDYEQAVVPPEARKLLSKFDTRSQHYETLISPETLT